MLYLWPRKAGKYSRFFAIEKLSAAISAAYLVSLLVGYELISANQITEYLISVDSLYNIWLWVRTKPHGSRVLSLFMYTGCIKKNGVHLLCQIISKITEAYSTVLDLF